MSLQRTTTNTMASDDKKDNFVSETEQRSNSIRTASHSDKIQLDLVTVVDPEKALVQQTTNTENGTGPPGQPAPGGGKPGGRSGLPPSHPMHPSQFVGDTYDKRALATLLGSFCVMVCHALVSPC